MSSLHYYHSLVYDHLGLDRYTGFTLIATRIQLVSTTIVYASTCLYFSVSVPYFVNAYAWDIANAETSSPLPLPTTNWGEGAQRAQSLILTATITVNVSEYQIGRAHV